MGLYLGRISVISRYVNFKPMYEYVGNKFEEVDPYAVLEGKSKNGDILFLEGTSVYVAGYRNEELVLFDFDINELEDNIVEGERKPTGLRVDVTKLSPGKIRRLPEFGYYYCVEAGNVAYLNSRKEESDYSKIKAPNIKDKSVYKGMEVVIRIKDDTDFLIGPVLVEERTTKGFEGCYVSTKLDTKKHFIEGLMYPGYEKRIEYFDELPYIKFDEAYCKEYKKDLIPQERLLEDFCTFVRSKGYEEKINIKKVNEILEKFEKDLFKGVPEDVKAERVKRLTELLTVGEEFSSAYDRIKSDLVWKELISALKAEMGEGQAEAAVQEEEKTALPDAVPVSDEDKEKIEKAEKTLADLQKQIADEEDALRKLKEDLKAFFDNSIENARQLAMDEKVLSLLQQAVLGDAGEETDYNSVAAKLRSIDKKKEGLKEHLVAEIKKYREKYEKNDILNILICISQGLLTVFSGEPGAGKTSICKIIASAMGLNTPSANIEAADGVFCDRFVNVSVKKGWTTERDLVGYYNPLTKTFDSSNRKLFDGLSILNEEAKGESSDLPYVVLLDEANLSPMEYYWADYMNICDDLDKNSEINLGDKYCFNVPGNLRFLATINNDHTTEALSPRLIDRAWVITLPEIDGGVMKALEDGDPISWKALSDVFGVKAETEISGEAEKVYNAVLEKTKAARIAVSHRVGDAIKRYWFVAKDVLEPEEERTSEIIALDYAIAQRILPHIDCVGKDAGEKLEELLDVLEGNRLNKSAEILNNILEKGNSDDMMSSYQFFA